METKQGTPKRVVLNGNAFELGEGGVLICAPLNRDGSIDDECWGEVADFSLEPDVQAVIDKAHAMLTGVPQ